MQRVIVSMQSFVLGEAIEQALKSAGNFYVTVVEDPKEIVKKCFGFAATALLMEVSGYAQYTLCERMKIRDKVKKQDVHCKVVLLVNEKEEKETAEEVKQLKRDGLIDQFIYGSSSASFLAALMETI